MLVLTVFVIIFGVGFLKGIQMIVDSYRQNTNHSNKNMNEHERQQKLRNYSFFGLRVEGLGLFTAVRVFVLLAGFVGSFPKGPCAQIV